MVGKPIQNKDESKAVQGNTCNKFLFGSMRLNTTECSNVYSGVDSKELDCIANTITEKLTFRCRQVMKTHRRTRACANMQPVIPVKCPKCFSRNCKCNANGKCGYHEKIVDSFKTLERLLSEQTLIQEAVRRLQQKSTLSQTKTDHYKSENGNSDFLCSHYTSYDSDSDVEL